MMSSAGVLYLLGVSIVHNGWQIGIFNAGNLTVLEKSESFGAPEASVSFPGLKGEAHLHTKYSDTHFCPTECVFFFFSYHRSQQLTTVRSHSVLIPVFVQLVIQVLVQAIPTMFSGLLVAMTVCLVFSIMGSHMFAGTFHYCFNETSEEYFLADSVENKSTCSSLISENYTEVRWKNTKYNFDNTVNGYVSLMHLVSVTTRHSHEKWMRQCLKTENKVAPIIYFQLQSLDFRS